jgi:hypothetical protein
VTGPYLTWACPCGVATNLDTQPDCATCRAPRPTPSPFRAALAAQALSLEEQLRRANARGLVTHDVQIAACDSDRVVIRIRMGDHPSQMTPFDLAVEENTVTVL